MCDEIWIIDYLGINKTAISGETSIPPSIVLASIATPANTFKNAQRPHRMAKWLFLRFLFFGRLFLHHFFNACPLFFDRGAAFSLVSRR